MLDGVASQETERTYDVPLDCLSRRNDPAGTVRDRPGALAGGAESAVVGIDRRHQRRRLRHGLVRGTRGARALSRGSPGVVRRESALPLPPHPLASLFRACTRRDRHADHAAELPSLRLRRWLFMHNGVIGNWGRLRRRVEGLIPDAFYGSRIGTTDSEAVFLAILGAGGDKDPVGASARVLGTLTEMVSSDGYREPLRFTAALANGRDLYAFRYAANDNANSLYYRESGGNVVVVSEPLDANRAHWKPVPPGHAIVARDGEPVSLEPFLAEQQVAAAE